MTGRTLTDSDLPAIFATADRASLRGQRTYLRATKLRLCLLLLAVAASAFSYDVKGVDLFGAVATIAFIATAVLETYFLRVKPDEIWYEGRAVAESAKTLAWRYAVGGDPFPISDDEETADRKFLDAVHEVAQDLRNIPLASTYATGEQITVAMRELRALPLGERRDAYREGRILDQLRWYSSKSQTNAKAATRWTYMMLSLEIIGGIGAFAKAANLTDIDLLGFAGALIATVAAWSQTKQHQNVSQAYAVAAQELSHISALIQWQKTEQLWSEFVDGSERAVSREHTLWKASRGLPTHESSKT